MNDTFLTIWEIAGHWARESISSDRNDVAIAIMDACYHGIICSSEDAQGHSFETFAGKPLNGFELNFNFFAGKKNAEEEEAVLAHSKQIKLRLSALDNFSKSRQFTLWARPHNLHRPIFFTQPLPQPSDDTIADDQLPKIQDQKKIEVLYQQRIAGWPLRKKPPSRAEDEAWVRDKFSGKGTRGLARHLRAKYAPITWTKKGKKTQKY